MSYTKVDIENWNRKEHFYHYKDTVRCGFSLTTRIDISKVLPFTKQHNYKFYPVIIYLLSRAVNKHSAFKLAMKEGELIQWDVVHPAYTVMHHDTETFSELQSTYSEDFHTFMAEYLRVEEAYKDNHALFPQKGHTPDNIFHISMIPWINFDGFNLNVQGESEYLGPIFTLGKYSLQGEEVHMPIAIQVHHAACDALHVAKLLDTLQQICDDVKDIE